MPNNQTLLVLLVSLLTVSCSSTAPTDTSMFTLSPNTTMGSLIPLPRSVRPSADTFTLVKGAGIYVSPASAELTAVGEYLAGKLNPSTGFAIQVASAAAPPASGNLFLTTDGGDPALGEEGYVLTITRDLVTLTAFRPAGLFRGIQTIRQLFPPSIESASVKSGPWNLPGGTISDSPRFGWRGAMLDVARHFFSVQGVERYIDLLAYYKINRFHFHLTDDQGWRIAINSWPNLAAHGGSTQVGGGPGGYYTQADYAAIVAYAQRRYMMVIPEIDMPGHTNAALASYAALNCSGLTPPLYTGIEVGFSSLCTNSAATYKFVDDVIGEVAAMTPGPYIHIGGDEAKSTVLTDYIRFVDSVQVIVESHGKKAIGWEEIAQSHLRPSSIAQHWVTEDFVRSAVHQERKVIMSPSSRSYMDMKYTPSTTLGQDWAGTIEVSNAYTWDPVTQVSGLSEADILGVEAPLWTETIQTVADVDYMAFPRLPGYAEIGWSAQAGRNWGEYRVRLGTHGPRLTAMGVNFYASPQVPWK